MLSVINCLASMLRIFRFTFMAKETFLSSLKCERLVENSRVQSSRVYNEHGNYEINILPKK